MKMNLLNIVVSVFLLNSVAEAQVIKKIHANNEVDLHSDEADFFAEGAEYVALDENGKKKALILVEFVDEGTASGKILKGKAQKGFTLVARDAKPKRSKNRFPASKTGVDWGAGAHFVSASQTIPGTYPSTTVTATGFAGHFEGLYGVSPQLHVGGTFKYAMLSSDGGGSITIMDIGVLGKYNFSEISAFAGFAPITNVSGGGSSISGTTLTFGAGYRINKEWEAIFEYRTIAVSGSTITAMCFGATYLF